MHVRTPGAQRSLPDYRPHYTDPSRELWPGLMPSGAVRVLTASRHHGQVPSISTSSEKLNTVLVQRVPTTATQPGTAGN